MMSSQNKNFHKKGALRRLFVLMLVSYQFFADGLPF